MSAIRSISPKFSIKQAEEIARSLYGLTHFVRELPSERDQNFLFRRDDGQEFTLKIANQDELKSVLEMQGQAMSRLGQGVKVLPTLDGQTIAAIDGPHFVRLVHFIPGVPLADFKPHSSRLLQNLGRLLGRTDKALQSFHHDAALRDLYWDIRKAKSVIGSYKGFIKDSRRRAIIEEIEIPNLDGLRTSVIHNDANDYNIIVTDEESIDLIDFGDMLETITVAEPAIACAYAMLHKPDPIAAAADLVRGYHETFPLTEPEIQMLDTLIRMRLAMSVTISAHQKQLEPENEYLLVSEKPAWELLEKLRGINPRFVHYTLRNACGLAPCPATQSVTTFLQKHAKDCARVLDTDLASEKAIVLDLSIGGLENVATEEAADVGRMTTVLFRKLEDAKADVAIGRYNEPRGFYTSRLFSTESNDGPEWRTIHLGIDLFAKAGSPVCTPLDGVVHSLRNNDALLDYGPTIVIRHATTDGQPFYTLYGHLSLDSLEHLTVGQAVRRGDRVASIGTYPTNGGWPPHLHFQIVSDLLDRDGEFPGVAAPSQRPVWLSLSPDPNLILQIPQSKFPKELPSGDETLSGRRHYIGPNLSISYRTPLKIVRGTGSNLFDDTGRGYLDCVNNVAHVGHCHPRVVRAGQAQMAVLNTNTRYLHDNIISYARALTSKLPSPLSVCFFVNSGSEANDLALRIARSYTKSNDVVVMDTAYHGNLTSLVEISPYKFDGPGGSGAPSNVRKVAIADGYRGRHKWRDPAIASKYAGELKDLQRPATFIIESLLSCAGQVVLPSGYLREAFQFVRRAGGLCIADEVQVGFGRVGTHFWGFETQEVVPDIVTMGKSIGNGHPLGAVVTTPQIAAAFHNGMEYFNTFGGNPVSCAVGRAVLQVIEDQKLQQNAHAVGQELIGRLRELQSRYELIGDVRGLGLFIGIELVRSRKTLDPAAKEAAYVIERMKARGILLSTDGPFHNVIKIKPPMVFSASDAEFLSSSLGLVLDENPVRIS